MVTSATVGYGDMYPRTTAGKMLSCCTAIAGIMVLAIPISIFSAKFTEEEVKEKQRKNLMEEARMSLADRAIMKEQSMRGYVLADTEDTGLHEDINDAIERKYKELQKQLVLLERNYRFKMLRKMYDWWQFNLPGRFLL